MALTAPWQIKRVAVDLDIERALVVAHTRKEIAPQQVPVRPHIFHGTGALIAHQMILVGVGVIVQLDLKISASSLVEHLRDSDSLLEHLLGGG